MERNGEGRVQRPREWGFGKRTRRALFADAAAAWATISVVPAQVVAAPGRVTPNSRPALAGVGVGGVGFPQLQDCERVGFDVVALCDVDDEYAKKAYDRWPKARRYRDFREMLATEGDKIDAVHCATPDHTHAIVTLAALRAGKHVCCVKPLTRSIQECRAVVEAARKAGVATQVTASPNTSEEACHTCEFIQAGVIGPVREVHIWTERPWWPQGMTRPAGEDPKRATLDWDLWLGPAPKRSFKGDWPDGHYALQQIQAFRGGAPISKAVYHPFNFRGWWDFGTGALGDMGCHYLNTPFRALNLKSPTSVEASSTRVFDETPPLASIVTLEFPARGGMPPVTVVWYDGGLKPPAPQELEGVPLPAEGTLYIGDEGKMLGARVLPGKRAKDPDSVPKTLQRRGDTFAEWMEAIRGGQPAGCNFDWAGPLTEAVLLGNVAIRAGKRIEWDPAEVRIKGNAEATKLLTVDYQNGWSL